MILSSTVNSAEKEIQPGWWFVFRGNHILVKAVESEPLIPFGAEITALKLKPLRLLPLGSRNGHCCFSAEWPADQPAPPGMAFKELRPLFGQLDDEMFWLAGRSFQVVHWDRTHQYCGSCGAPTQNKVDEYAKLCPQCGHSAYPNPSPAIIVAVRKSRQLLLARSWRHPTGRYSVLAGFVELGETLEACVEREVREEVGLKIKNIRYFGSQSWPFPNSLMIGFTAEYAGGEIHIDNREILDAEWFSAPDIPRVPGKISIASRLIEWFAENYK